jgi:hypothetical protein
MSHTLVLDIPEEAYAELLRAASLNGLAPEQVAQRILEDMLVDPVLQLAGCIKSPVTDAGERHDEYIGQAIYDQSDF